MSISPKGILDYLSMLRVPWLPPRLEKPRQYHARSRLSRDGPIHYDIPAETGVKGQE